MARIDEADWPLVAPYTWYAHHDQDGRWYAQTNARRRDGRGFTLPMHRVIAGAGEGEVVDHVDRAATLDNRRRNIRVCTNARNPRNIGARGGKSPFKGVSWNAEKRCWKVAFQCVGRFRFVGYFADEEAAARAYDEAILPLAGGFARLNRSHAA